MTERALQAFATLIEQSKLLGGELIEVITVAAHEMGEHRAGDHRLLMAQAIDELLHVCKGIKA